MVDSCASDHVIPAKEVPCASTVPGKAFKKRVNYVAADGGRIPNLGEEHLNLVLADAHRAKVAFRVADVTRPILSVSKLI